MQTRIIRQGSNGTKQCKALLTFAIKTTFLMTLWSYYDVTRDISEVVNIPNVFLFCQDTVVLGKNGRHSFGRAQDRIPAPTLTPTRSNFRTNWKNELET